MPSIPGVPASQAKIFVDEFELTQQSSGAVLTSDMAVLDYNIMGDVAKQTQVTSPAITIAHSGYYTGRGASDGLGYFEDTLRSRLGTTAPVIATLVLGGLVYTLSGTWGSQLTIDAPVADLITIEGNWAAPDATFRGPFIESGSYSNGGLSAFADLGAASLYDSIVVHASGFADLTAGAESVTVNVQTAATSGGSYTTWLTKVFKKPGAFIVTGAVNPNRYAKINVVLTAGVAGPVNVMAGVIT